MLVSAVQQSESTLCIHISFPSWTSLPPPPTYPTPLGHHRALSWAPCAIQQLPTSYFTHGQTAAAAAAAKSLQLCPTLCNPIDGSPPGSPVPGLLQARTLEWVAISFSNAWKWKAKVKLLSGVPLLVTPWTAAHQAPPSMGFSRQEYWSGVPLPSLMVRLTFFKQTVAINPVQKTETTPYKTPKTKPKQRNPKKPASWRYS